MRLSDKRIRQIIREEIGRRYGLLNEKENEKDLDEAGGVADTMAAMGAGAAAGAWMGGPWGAAAGALVGGIAYTAFSKGDTSEISADAKTAAAFLQEDPDAFNKVEEAQKTGGMAELELVSSSNMRSAAAALNDAIKGMGTDEEAIAETLNSLPTILDISGVSSIYADLYNKSLLDALAGDLGSKELRRYVHRVIDDKPFAMIGGKKIDTYAEMGEALEAGDVEEEAEAVADKDVQRLQKALGTQVTGILNQDDIDAVRDEILDNYAPQEDQPSKKQVAMAIQQRVQNISEENPLGRGGARPFVQLGYRGARSNFWGAVADFVTSAGGPAPVAEAKKNLKVQALIRSLVKNNLKNRVLREQLSFDMSEFEEEVVEPGEEPAPGGKKTRRVAKGGRGKPDVKELQKIIGSKADGIWGPNTQAAFSEFVKGKSAPLGEEWEASASAISGNWASGASKASSLSGQSFSADPGGALAFARWLGGAQAASAQAGKARGGVSVAPRKAPFASAGEVTAGAWDASVSPRGVLPQTVLNSISSLAAEMAKKAGRITIMTKQAMIAIKANPPGMLPGGPLSPERMALRREIKDHGVKPGVTITVTVNEA